MFNGIFTCIYNYVLLIKLLIMAKLKLKKGYLLISLEEYEKTKTYIGVLEQENRKILELISDKENFDYIFTIFGSNQVYGINEHTKKLKHEIEILNKEIEKLKNRNLFQRIFNKI